MEAFTKGLETPICAPSMEKRARDTISVLTDLGWKR